MTDKGIDGRRRGAWLGLAVGDALGAPVEFQSAERIAERHGRVTEMMAGGPWLKGEWTDDTALALANAEAYAGDSFELEAAAQAMVAWKQTGPKDIGNLTAAALRLIERGEATGETAGALALAQRPNAAGNGSLMRAAPTGLVRLPDDPRLEEEARLLSAVTHADERCLAACVAFCATLSTLVHGGPGIDEALAVGRAAADGKNSEVDRILDRVILREPALYSNSDGIGYVLLCLERGMVTLRDAVSFEAGLIEVVNYGGDTDTNGAVAGALLGARFGLGGIPERWLASLLQREAVEAALGYLTGG